MIVLIPVLCVIILVAVTVAPLLVIFGCLLIGRAIEELLE